MTAKCDQQARKYSHYEWSSSQNCTSKHDYHSPSSGSRSCLQRTRASVQPQRWAKRYGRTSTSLCEYSRSILFNSTEASTINLRMCFVHGRTRNALCYSSVEPSFSGRAHSIHQLNVKQEYKHGASLKCS